jgi:hypothetical protein
VEAESAQDCSRIVECSNEFEWNEKLDLSITTRPRMFSLSVFIKKKKGAAFGKDEKLGSVEYSE